MLPRVSNKRKFVADGVLFAELNEFLGKELTDVGYAGVRILNAPMATHIVIRSADSTKVAGRRLRELTSVIKKRFKFTHSEVVVMSEKIAERGLSAQAQAESLKFKLLQGMVVRRACYSVIKSVMESQAKGVEVVVAGKLRGQRAKAMKFREGYMVKTGQSAVDYNDYATRHIMMRQGIMGVRVKIMLPTAITHTGRPAKLADFVQIINPAAPKVSKKH